MKNILVISFLFFSIAFICRAAPLSIESDHLGEVIRVDLPESMYAGSFRVVTLNDTKVFRITTIRVPIDNNRFHTHAKVNILPKYRNFLEVDFDTYENGSLKSVFFKGLPDGTYQILSPQQWKNLDDSGITSNSHEMIYPQAFPIIFNIENKYLNKRAN